MMTNATKNPQVKPKRKADEGTDETLTSPKDAKDAKEKPKTRRRFHQRVKDPQPRFLKKMLYK